MTETSTWSSLVWHPKVHSGNPDDRWMVTYPRGLYGGDVDFFVFEAVEGELYELSVEPGTLEDPTVALYDADGMWLDFDDDSGGALAPRLYLRAASTGPLYVEVGGYGTGSYTLMITR